jgi:ribosomal protein S18 acetylase RimI-like enzyme
VSDLPAAPSPGAASAIDLAVEVFARGYAFTRSFTHPYLAERVGPLWALRDAPRRRAADYRREEWAAHGVEPAEVDRVARAGARGRFAICAVRALDEPAEPLRAAYRALGYRLTATEPVMEHALERLPPFEGPLPVERVLTPALADAVNEAAGQRQILPEHLAPGALLRQYAALDGDRPAGWVRSVVVGDATWVSNMWVDPAYRRRGIGRSMLARMLHDDREHGIARSVLTASHTGALLYPRVGYSQIGELLLYMPKVFSTTPGSSR